MHLIRVGLNLYRDQYPALAIIKPSVVLFFQLTLENIKGQAHIPTPNATFNDFKKESVICSKMCTGYLQLWLFFPSADKETCFDVEKERCENFEFYCGTRYQFMSNFCKLTCKMCVPGQTPPPSPPATFIAVFKTTPTNVFRIPSSSY